MDKKLFQERLKKLMKENGYDAKSLSAASGVSRNSIYDYLRGTHDPSTTNLNKLSDCLKCSVLYLIGVKN